MANDPVAPGPGFRFLKVPDKKGARAVGGSVIRRAPGRNNPFDWFWRKIDADINAANSERLQSLRKLMATKIQSKQNADLVQKIMKSWKAEIDFAAREAQIAPQLLAAIIAIESAGDPNAVSRSGATGLAQLMPATAERFRVNDPFNPQENLTGAAAFLSVLLDMFEQDLVLTLAAYNAGDGAVREYHGVPPYDETRAYVPKVLGALVMAERECVQHLSGARDQCQRK
ncbi:MAG: lytic transglycosylase domain-containing protein [Pikeienuella sp.]